MKWWKRLHGAQFQRRLLKQFFSCGNRHHPKLHLGKAKKYARVLVKRGLRSVTPRLLLLLLTIGIVAACSGTAIEHNKVLTTKPLTTPCHVVQHAMGESCIPTNPQRILTLGSFNLGDVLALLDTKPIGTVIVRENEIRYLEKQAEGIELIHSIVGEFNLEKILSLHPDLIIGLSVQNSRKIYQQLSQIAPTVLTPWDEISYDWKQRFQYFAVIFDKLEAFNQLMTDYNRRVKELKQVIGDRRRQIQASILYVLPDHFSIAYKNSFPGSILNDIDLLSPSEQIPEGGFRKISLEVLPEIDSEVLFLLKIDRGNNEASEVFTQLQGQPLWSELKAVQLNQVYLVDSAVWHGYNIFAAHAVLDDLFKYLVNTP